MESAKNHTLPWIAVTLLLFPVLVILGIFMRVLQAGSFASLQEWFYPVMTLHGLGMVGIWYVASMAAASQVLERYTKPSLAVSRFALGGTVLGVVLLLVAILIGKFAAGWYFLYPLPFRGYWPAWASVTFLVSLTVLGATWLIWTLDLLRAIAQKFTLAQALGWHYIAGRTEPELPPAVLIITVSLIVCIACLVSGVAVLSLFYFELLTGTASDALLMKNLTFFFGHVLVNLSLYLAVAVVYEILPGYCNRPWKTNKVVVISWNTVLLIVMIAYFHHLYMDFVQPTTLQYIGQVSSYASAIPAAIVTLFGALALVYRAPVRWNFTSLAFFIGLMGWAIGGIGAVIDSTIVVNKTLHNTLWVPAHFHSYMLMGLALMLLGYFYHYCQALTRAPERKDFEQILVLLLTIGGYGLLLMFYISGAYSVPRRFAAYPDELWHGAVFSAIGAVFAGVFLLGLLIYVWETGKHWTRAYRQA